MYKNEQLQLRIDWTIIFEEGQEKYTVKLWYAGLVNAQPYIKINVSSSMNCTVVHETLTCIQNVTTLH